MDFLRKLESTTNKRQETLINSIKLGNIRSGHYVMLFSTTAYMIEIGRKEKQNIHLYELDKINILIITSRKLF